MADLICTTCGARGAGTPRGSTGVELVLWLCFFVPGFIYSVWRHGGRACHACGAGGLVPSGSIIGRKMIEDGTASAMPGKGGGGTTLLAWVIVVGILISALVTILQAIQG